jgi:hypothetical protein
MSALGAIQAALETRLANMPNAPTRTFENVVFTPTPGVPYIQAQFIPTMRRAAVMGPDPQKQYTGLFIMDVCYPELMGSGAARNMADDLMEYFDAASRIAGVDVTITIEYSEREQGFKRPPFYCIPVRVGWRCYAD